MMRKEVLLLRPLGVDNLAVYQWENRGVAVNVRTYNKIWRYPFILPSSKNLKKRILSQSFGIFTFLDSVFTEWFLTVINKFEQ